MPQLEVSTYASQIFWLIVAFSTLYWLLSRKALPRVAEILEARQDRMAADLDQAQRLRSEAEEAIRAYEEHVARAREDAHRTIAATQKKLQTDAATRQAAIDAEVGKQVQEAEAGIRDARDEAMKELEDGAADAAQDAVERLVGIKVTKKSAQAALRSVRKEAA
jgi:F-type H+-transporting ATPase subunit b